MRIDYLKLERYRNLINFEVDFDPSSSKQVIVGRNGTGKSNLLEAITEIFRDLDLQEDSNFGYIIEYQCNGFWVKIHCYNSSDESLFKGSAEEVNFKRDYYIAVFDSPKNERVYKQLSHSEFCHRNKNRVSRLLPQYVFGYYSGVSQRLNNIFQTHEKQYYKDQKDGVETPLRTLFQAKPHHSQFALLAFYASEEDEAKEFLKEEFHITGIDSVLFSLQQPYWGKGKPAPEKIEKGDERFWYAAGKVNLFLKDLYDLSLAPMSGKENLTVSIGTRKTKEKRYCYIPSQEILMQLAKGLDSKEFFARLESLFFSDLIDESGSDISIRFTLKNSNDAITFQDLSEGERQLITVLGLMRFTAEKEALFLFDEPDTHLNPAWCLDYLQKLKLYGAEPPNSQIILTTHSPLTFAGLDKSEVVIFEKEEDDKVYSYHPYTSPKGMGFAAILTSDYFGLRSTLDMATLKKIDEKRELGLKENKSDAERRRLSELNDELNDLDFTSSIRDPLYHEYVKAMTQAQIDDPDISPNVLSHPSWQKRKKIAADIAKKLLS